jgi:hypothetical protein
VKLSLIDLPEDPARLAMWLEQKLLSLDLRDLVIELEAIHGSNNDGRKLEDLIGPSLLRVLDRGLSQLSVDELLALLQFPRSLVLLQELIFTEGSNYWKSVETEADHHGTVDRGWQNLEKLLEKSPASSTGFGDGGDTRQLPSRAADNPIDRIRRRIRAWRMQIPLRPRTPGSIPALRKSRWRKWAFSGIAVALLLGMGLSLYSTKVSLRGVNSVTTEQLRVSNARIRASTVSFTTTPPGARVVFVPLDTETGEPVAERAVRPTALTPVKLKLMPATYLVVVAIDENRFHEVYRTVPSTDAIPSRRQHDRWSDENGVIVLAAVDQIPSQDEVTKGMAHCAEADLRMTDSHGKKDFFIKAVEVSVEEYKSVMQSLPPPLLEENPRVDPKAPIRYVQYSDAMEYAERVGLRLPTESEYEFAATNAGTQKFPWGDDANRIVTWPIDRPSPFDVTPTNPPISGLYSGVAEWTVSREGAYPATQRPSQSGHFHMVRGAPFPVLSGRGSLDEWRIGPECRYPVDDDEALPGLGFRCVRSAKPRF